MGSLLEDGPSALYDALSTVRAWAKPLGVPWSNSTSTGGRFGTKALNHELEDSRNLVARHLELLHDLVDAEVFEVLDDGGDGQTGTLEDPRAADPVGHATTCS